MRTTIVRKRPLHGRDDEDDLKGMPPQALIGMMWQLALDAWAFKERLNVEPRLQRHVVVLKRRGG
jgi:hypothetical protein